VRLLLRGRRADRLQLDPPPGAVVPGAPGPLGRLRLGALRLRRLHRAGRRRRARPDLPLAGVRRRGHPGTRRRTGRLHLGPERGPGDLLHEPGRHGRPPAHPRDRLRRRALLQPRRRQDRLPGPPSRGPGGGGGLSPAPGPGAHPPHPARRLGHGRRRLEQGPGHRQRRRQLRPLLPSLRPEGRLLEQHARSHGPGLRPLHGGRRRHGAGAGHRGPGLRRLPHVQPGRPRRLRLRLEPGRRRGGGDERLPGRVGGGPGSPGPPGAGLRRGRRAAAGPSSGVGGSGRGGRPRHGGVPVGGPRRHGRRPGRLHRPLPGGRHPEGAAGRLGRRGVRRRVPGLRLPAPGPGPRGRGRRLLPAGAPGQRPEPPRPGRDRPERPGGPPGGGPGAAGRVRGGGGPLRPPGHGRDGLARRRPGDPQRRRRQRQRRGRHGGRRRADGRRSTARPLGPLHGLHRRGERPPGLVALGGESHRAPGRRGGHDQPGHGGPPGRERAGRLRLGHRRGVGRLPAGDAPPGRDRRRELRGRGVRGERPDVVLRPGSPGPPPLHEHPLPVPPTRGRLGPDRRGRGPDPVRGGGDAGPGGGRSGPPGRGPGPRGPRGVGRRGGHAGLRRLPGQHSRLQPRGARGPPQRGPGRIAGGPGRSPGRRRHRRPTPSGPTSPATPWWWNGSGTGRRCRPRRRWAHGSRGSGAVPGSGHRRAGRPPSRPAAPLRHLDLLAGPGRLAATAPARSARPGSGRCSGRSR